MSNEMVERVGKVLRMIEGCHEGCNHCKRAAKAAIEAMKEPTQAMIKAGDLSENMAVEVWKDMVEAALKE